METEKLAAELLHSVGMSPKYKGYTFSHFILTLSIRDITRTYNMSALLYNAVSEHYKVSPCIVERNIRFAIKRAWEEDYTGNMHRLFNSYGINYIPTNREFICILTDCVRHDRSVSNIQMRMW